MTRWSEEDAVVSRRGPAVVAFCFLPEGLRCVEALQERWGVCVSKSDAGPAACSQDGGDEVAEMNRWYYIAVF